MMLWHFVIFFFSKPVMNYYLLDFLNKDYNLTTGTFTVINFY